MARKRDYLVEILEKRSRLHRRSHRFEQFKMRFSPIWDAYEFLRVHGKQVPHVRAELLKYISIGIVACLEGYFRTVIRDLIDAGPPYQDNVRKLEEIRLDLGTVVGMGREKISPGEFISHLLPLSSLDDINRHMTTIMGADFLDVIKRVPDPRTGDTIAEIAGGIFEQIRTAFRQRHIFCHELAPKVQPTLRMEREILGSCLLLIVTTEFLVYPILQDGTLVPTGMRMREQLSNEA
ncbi:MAG TPA: hypothetical protein VHG28_06290 [Longimicrobiaceae bacterium]|nr:hypothetical protein [Longimicrobiaceae bacterium]